MKPGDLIKFDGKSGVNSGILITIYEFHKARLVEIQTNKTLICGVFFEDQAYYPKVKPTSIYCSEFWFKTIFENYELAVKCNTPQSVDENILLREIFALKNPPLHINGMKDLLDKVRSLRDTMCHTLF